MCLLVLRGYPLGWARLARVLTRPLWRSMRSRLSFDLHKILFDGATHQGDCPRCLVSALVSELQDSYLVDPASSHMLVSKIKPCMSKYKHFCTVKLRMAH